MNDSKNNKGKDCFWVIVIVIAVIVVGGWSNGNSKKQNAGNNNGGGWFRSSCAMCNGTGQRPCPVHNCFGGYCRTIGTDGYVCGVCHGRGTTTCYH